jgi:hypothetical protein
MTADGTIVVVTGESAAYADLGPGAVVLHASANLDPSIYVDTWIRQDGETRLIYLWLGAAGPEFGTEPPPEHCPPRFADKPACSNWRSRNAWAAYERARRDFIFKMGAETGGAIPAA